jgi:alginate O-acetyltransferase complex protein AlgJ
LFARRLEEAKIRLFDPAAVLRREKAAHPDRPLYLRTDTHWTPAAMERVAGELAGFARQAVALPPALNRYAAAGITVTNLGDVAVMLKQPAEWKIYEPEMAEVRQISDAGNLWRPDPKAEVLFLGDSFANIYSLEPMGWGESAGFVEHLSLALGLPVDAICRNDAGSYATREMLAKELNRGNDRLAGKKLVIWEFAARELACGDWKLLPLSLGVKKEAGYYTPPPGKTLTIRGIVRAASPPPRPGSVPYKDHIIMLHLAELESDEDPAATGQKTVVFVWSMRNNVLTPAARHRPGDTVRLRVCRWADVTAKYGAINRSELDDEELALAEPLWAEGEK